MLMLVHNYLNYGSGWTTDTGTGLYIGQSVTSSLVKFASIFSLAQAIHL